MQRSTGRRLTGLNVDFTGRVDDDGGTSIGGAMMYSAPIATIVIPIAVREQFEVTPATLTVRVKLGFSVNSFTEGTHTTLLLAS